MTTQSALDETVSRQEVAPYRPFEATVTRVTRLSPSFVRVTFAGDDLGQVSRAGADQRVKLVLPVPGQERPVLPDGPNWYQQYRRLDPRARPVIRTYTIRHLRPVSSEVDVDLVLHGATGPASAWAGRVVAGDRVVLVAPDARYGGDPGGYEWRPPAPGSRLLVVADETAVPAASVIVESLPAGCRADVLLEVPRHGDVLPLDARPGVSVRWLPRDVGGEAAGYGQRLVDAVRGLDLDRLGAAPQVEADPSDDGGRSLTDQDQGDDGLLWETVGGEPAAGRGLHAWVAGEASAVRTIRRHLVEVVGVPRASVSFMGYWRLGRAEA